ncbi:MAG: hypothetical protein ABIH80_05910 [Methanobacteriota archaeon]
MPVILALEPYILISASERAKKIKGRSSRILRKIYKQKTLSSPVPFKYGVCDFGNYLKIGVSKEFKCSDRELKYRFNSLF